MNIEKLLKKEKILAIGVDCGFYGVKIDINKSKFEFPSYIIPLKSQDEIILSTYENADADKIIYSERQTNAAMDSYIIGSTAKTLINHYPQDGPYRTLIENIKKLDVFFGMEEAIYMIRAAVAYAIIKYSQDNAIGFALEDLSDYKIYLELTFPHSLRKQAFGYLKGPLSENTIIDFQLNEKLYTIPLQIDGANISGSSQVLAVFYNLLLTEDGEPVKNVKEVMDLLPAVINDGGYRTNGLASVRKDAALMVEHVDSYEDFAMIEINKKTAEIINKKAMESDVIDYNPIKEYDIAQYIASETDFIYDIKDSTKKLGKRRVRVRFGEIAAIHDKVLKDMSEKYCEFLINTYDIGNAKSIIIAGGTGAAYADIINEYISDYTDGEVKVVFANNPSDGNELNPVFSIVVGAHKFLMKRLSNLYD